MYGEIFFVTVANKNTYTGWQNCELSEDGESEGTEFNLFRQFMLL